MIEAADSERIVISQCWQDPAKYLPLTMAEGVTAAHFAVPSTRFLWETFKSHWRGETLESLSLPVLSESVRQTGDLAKYWENLSGLSEIYWACPNHDSWKSSLKKLLDTHARRQAEEAAQGLHDLSNDPHADPADLEAAARSALDTIAKALSAPSKTLNAQQSSKAFLTHWEALQTENKGAGIPTGMQPVDLLTSGPKRGELWVVAAETSGGKSVFMNQAAGHAADQGFKPLIFSLEMDTEQVTARLLAGTWNAPFSRLVDPVGATQGDIDRIQLAMKRFLKCSIFINDDAEVTTERVHAETERLNDLHGLDLVVVDYLQLLDGERKRNERQDEEISRNVKKLKQLAKKFKVAVITASQLNDEGKLFASRAIGHHADVVMRIKEEGIFVAKNRNGKRGDTLPLILNGAKQRFEQRGDAPPF